LVWKEAKPRNAERELVDTTIEISKVDTSIKNTSNILTTFLSTFNLLIELFLIRFFMSFIIYLYNHHPIPQIKIPSNLQRILY